jgi:hypothetical protein
MRGDAGRFGCVCKYPPPTPAKLTRKMPRSPTTIGLPALGPFAGDRAGSGVTIGSGSTSGSAERDVVDGGDEGIWLFRLESFPDIALAP